jgi:hypothetical protein
MQWALAMAKQSSLVLAPLLLTLGSAACDRSANSSEEAAAPIASVEGSIEAAVDAPWRLEPIPTGGPGDVTDSYPDIPIVVSVHDAAQQEDPEVALDVGLFCGVVVRERLNGVPLQVDYRDGELTPYSFVDYDSFIPATAPQVREIEVSGPWPATTAGPILPSLCRQWAGEDCTLQRDLAPTTEWHATIMYRPAQLDPRAWFPYRNGDDVELEVTAIFAPRGRPCPTSIAFYHAAKGDRLGVDGYGLHSVGAELRVHLGEAGLPRFDGGWVYGDLHYHAQGTDNEGESAYAHRPVLQAMRALGLDFAFATDHASDSSSGQVTDADDIYIDNVSLPGPHVLSEIAQSLLDYLDAGLPFATTVSAARDMHETRFRFLANHLNAAGTGANAEVLKVAPGLAFAPQLFQGAEVDVVPEVSADEARRGRLIYGYDMEYRFMNACTDVPPLITALERWSTYDLCQHGLTDATPDPNRFTVNDIQIITDQYHARQHLLHLPTSSTRIDTFVSGRTSLYGGASRALSEVLQHEYTEARKGIAFLAHPADAAFGRHLGRLGPDLVPYSQVQLETAFQAQDLLGLQLWNEDPRLATGTMEPYMLLVLGTQSWDRMLQWGLRDSMTRGLSWLEPGEPRRVFMAGGSDAHGDLNYRRLGRREGEDGRHDTAIGKPRNLVFVGEERARRVVAGDVAVGALGQEQVTDALRSGNFAVTDGPALRIVVDVNGNGRIDDADVPMGGVADLASGRLPLIVEWKSTPEFKELESVAIYLGVSDGERTMLYASPSHGVHAVGFGAPTPDKVYEDTHGVDHVSLVGGYMQDSTGALFVPIPAGAGMMGQRAITLDLADFPVGTLHEEPGVPGKCEPNGYCNRPGYGDLCDEICEPDGPATLTFRNPTSPLRVYARAFAITRRVQAVPCETEACVARLAYTNPVWARQVVPLDLPANPFPGQPAPGSASVAVGGLCQTTNDCVCDAYCALPEPGLDRVPSGTCARRLKDGACSDSSMCVASAFCERGQCVARRQQGESCDRSAPCAPGLTCDPDVCSIDLRATPVCH